ncbi:Nucleolysin TIA-1 [Smittium mucronatum]|uniref:Nucleolysin TIA-1 n=1 Tax=Smittium mucronatum TaxID=133383 RepID=A0A1R0H872_9FUNG|nr:Nucleolysin TIA-1 [Smittium mucronatum]
MSDVDSVTQRFKEAKISDNTGLETQPHSNNDHKDPETTTLYVGNLDVRADEQMMFDIFSAVGPVIRCKIFKDKLFLKNEVCYGFVEFPDTESAQVALKHMDGRKIFDFNIRVNWAMDKNSLPQEKIPPNFQVYIGDLSPETTREDLISSFSQVNGVSNIKLMTDDETGASKCYGFVNFSSHDVAIDFIGKMDGSLINSRPVKVNWAYNSANNNRNVNKRFYNNRNQNLDYDTVFSQTSPHNNIIYCGNLSQYTQQDHLLRLFVQYGNVIDIRMQPNRGFAFVKMDNHQDATSSIVNINGMFLNGKNIVCSWGKGHGPDSDNSPRNNNYETQANNSSNGDNLNTASVNKSYYRGTGRDFKNHVEHNNNSYENQNPDNRYSNQYKNREYINSNS